MGEYSITVLEYGRKIGFSNAMIYSGYYGDGESTDITYTFNAIQKDGEVILVDTGYDDKKPDSKAQSEKLEVVDYQNPAVVLGKIGIRAEDVKHVIITHAHWDHMGGIRLFPNATFYLQKDELLDWIATMTLPRECDILKDSIMPADLELCVGLIRENRLVLLDGDVDDLFPGIDIRVARNGHSFASNIVIVHTHGKKYVLAGDCAYVKANITGGRGDGVSMPNGFAVGSAYNVILTCQDILRYADGHIENVLVGHDAGTFDAYESEKTADGLHIAYVVK